MDISKSTWIHVSEIDKEKDAKNIGIISCSPNGTIEKYLGDNISQTIIPGDVMLKAVKIALNKIKEEDNA